LITAAVGYWVLTAAAKEKGRVKKVGEILALIIILVSLAGIVCRVYSLAQANGYCPVGKTPCPFSGRSVPSQPTQ